MARSSLAGDGVGVASAERLYGQGVKTVFWYASFSFMWSAIEINVGIMVACVPALKPLVRRFLPQWILDQTVRGDKSGTQTSDSMAAVHPDIADSRRRSNLHSAPVSPLSPTSPTAPLTKPPPALGGGGGGGEPMDMMAFLTTPDMNEMSQLHQTNTVVTHATTARGRRPSVAFFDFVDMGKKKNITLRSNRESIYPILMVTVLFFIWGFAYGLLDTLNAQFQAVARMSNGQTIGQHTRHPCDTF